MPEHNNFAAAEQRVVRELQRNREVVERSAEHLAGQLRRAAAVQTPTEQRTREREHGRVLRETAINEEQLRAADRARRNGVMQTSRRGRYIDLEGSTLAGYTNGYIVSVNQNRPIHADFESSYQYNIFLQSKYKHHHKCGTCQMVFRCGKPKCDCTLCRLCSLRSELSAPASWNSDEAVRLSFNGGRGGGSWTNISTGHEVVVAHDEAAQNSFVTVDEVERWITASQDTVVTADFEAAERQVRNESVATTIEEGIEI